MNPRIREFEKQCWSHQANCLDAEKFAGMIVRECCQFNYDFLESYSEASEVNGKIREHFGVEE